MVRVRLKRTGTRNALCFRIVVMDQRSARDGKSIEELGFYNPRSKEEKIKLYFNSPIDVLKHLKLTGVNAIKEHKFTKSSLKEFEKKYYEQYSEDGKVYFSNNWYKTF